MTVLLARRRIEAVPLSLVATLDLEGRIPALPKAVEETQAWGTPEMPTPTDLLSLSWLLDWDGRTVFAYAAYRDEYDFHSASRVRRCVTIAGSARGCVDLVRTMNAGANGKLVGEVGSHNGEMRALLVSMGFVADRVFFRMPS